MAAGQPDPGGWHLHRSGAAAGTPAVSELQGSGPGPSSNLDSSFLSSADFWHLFGAELGERHRGRAGELVRA